MGRHTKDVEDDLPADDGSRRRRRVGKVPLLPAVTGVVAIGAVVSAISTQQISLNFAGGPPADQTPQPQVSESPGTPGQDRRATQDGSALTPRSGSLVSRGDRRLLITVASTLVSKWTTGYQRQITITNTSSRTINGWKLVLRYPDTKILSAWDVRIVSKGTTLIAENPVDHPTLEPRHSVTISITARGKVARPSLCEINERPC